MKPAIPFPKTCLGLLICLLLLLGCSPSKPQLHVFTWPDYFDPQVIAEFERQHNCKVTLDVFDTFDSLLAKLAGGGDSTYDIVTSGQASIPPLRARDLIAPLRLDKLPNLKHIDPRFRNPVYDPEERYSVPYLWGTTGVFMRKPKDKPIPDSWAVLFDPAAQPGDFVLTDDIGFSIQAALLYLGLKPASTNRADLDRVYQTLDGAKKRSKGFASSYSARNRVLSKDLTACLAYNNDAASGIREDPDSVLFFVPREGGGLWMDTLSITARAPHRDLAEQFINFMMDPKIAAQNAAFTHAATPNASALPLLPESERTNTIIYPTAETLNRLHMSYDLGVANKLYEDLWSQLRVR